jgi:hypothetical protein
VSSSDVIGEATVSAPDTEIVLRIDLAAQEVTGELLVEGRPACPFRSWVELVTALDGALDTLRAPSAKN